MNLITSERQVRIERFIWALVLIALPVTSFRFMPFMGSDSQVRPLSLLPAIFLFFVLILRGIRERRFIFWSSSLQPLLIFALAAIFSSAIGFLFAPVNLYSYSYSSRLLRAWITFGIGLLFLVTTLCMNHSEDDLKFTIKWIYVGLAVDVAWSCVQILNIYIFQANIVDQIQKTVMMAGSAPNNRISGLALEPSWLAAQVMAIYFPWAFAAVLKDYYWNKHRWQVPAILAACVVLMIYTYSRAGILTAVATVILTFVIAGWDKIRQAWKWFFNPMKTPERTRWIGVGLRIAIVAVIFAGLVGGTHVLSRNKYFAQIWQSKKNTLVAYFVDIYAGPRLAVSVAGWTIFEQHPFTGVGLGAAGLYLHKALPDWAHFNISEIAQLLSSDNQTYPNTKNLYIRLLSETGILGFWAFIAFYLLMFGKTLDLLRSKQKHLLFLGAASLVALFTIVVLGITQDSLAMPTVWLPFGILIGMTDRKT
jgi:O-antigen ligase